MSDYEHEIGAHVYDREGFRISAYIDSRTGIGTAKHSGRAIRARWDETQQRWVEIEPRALDGEIL
jgi:hypothetical protein